MRDEADEVPDRQTVAGRRIAAGDRGSVDALVDEPALASYPFLPSVRGDLLAKFWRVAEANRELERAADLTRNERDRKRFVTVPAVHRLRVRAPRPSNRVHSCDSCVGALRHVARMTLGRRDSRVPSP